jgi:hypothetical protein
MSTPPDYESGRLANIVTLLAIVVVVGVGALLFSLV